MKTIHAVKRTEIELNPSTFPWEIVNDGLFHLAEVDVGPWKVSLEQDEDFGVITVNFTCCIDGSCGAGRAYDRVNEVFPNWKAAQEAAERHVLELLRDMLTSIGEVMQ